MREAIPKTLAYFDLFDYPLTVFELWKFLQIGEPCSIDKMITTLDDPLLASEIEKQNGFLCLRGRTEIVRTRLSRYAAAERKFGYALRAARYLRRIPGIRLVAVANTLAWSHSRDESDIDLFIVTRPGAIWSSRLAAVTPFALLGLRPTERRVRDTFCFSFFVTEQALDLKPLAIAPDDPYLCYWMASLTALYDPDGLMEALWDTNQWVHERLPNARPVELSARRRLDAPSRGDLRLSDGRLSLGETFARALQLVTFPAALTRIMNLDQRVVVTDNILKFHENDRREEIRQRYEKRCQEVLGS